VTDSTTPHVAQTATRVGGNGAALDGPGDVAMGAGVVLTGAGDAALVVTSVAGAGVSSGTG
jgi:hypothetical protein